MKWFETQAKRKVRGKMNSISNILKVTKDFDPGDREWSAGLPWQLSVVGLLADPDDDLSVPVWQRHILVNDLYEQARWKYLVNYLITTTFTQYMWHIRNKQWPQLIFSSAGHSFIYAVFFFKNSTVQMYSQIYPSGKSFSRQISRFTRSKAIGQFTINSLWETKTNRVLNPTLFKEALVLSNRSGHEEK